MVKIVKTDACRITSHWQFCFRLSRLAVPLDFYIFFSLHRAIFGFGNGGNERKHEIFINYDYGVIVVFFSLSLYSINAWSALICQRSWYCCCCSNHWYSTRVLLLLLSLMVWNEMMEAGKWLWIWAISKYDTGKSIQLHHLSNQNDWMGTKDSIFSVINFHRVCSRRSSSS